ncbi:MAG: anion permease [Candidatus Omnitrophota bacterium]
MHLFLIGITLLMGGYIGWAIGANDAANCVGANIGSGKMTLRQGIFITCFFCFLGAVLLGSRVMKTLGKGIVPLDQLDPNIAILVALAACFSAGTWVIIATVRGLPVSTSHSIVGAVAGAGLAIGAPVIWKKLLDIFVCWVFTPIGAAVMAYVFYFPFRVLFQRLVPQRFVDQVYTFFAFATSIYLAFIWGANDVANATGVVTGVGALTSFQAALFGAIAILIGIVTFGSRVIQTIGFGITHLSPLMAIVAAMASGFNVHLYTLFGIPVSTSHSIVGAVVGVGLVKNIKMINKKLVKEIIFAWSLTPFASGVIAFFVVKFLRLLIH